MCFTFFVHVKKMDWLFYETFDSPASEVCTPAFLQPSSPSAGSNQRTVRWWWPTNKMSVSPCFFVFFACVWKCSTFSCITEQEIMHKACGSVIFFHSLRWMIRLHCFLELSLHSTAREIFLPHLPRQLEPGMQRREPDKPRLWLGCLRRDRSHVPWPCWRI